MKNLFLPFLLLVVSCSYRVPTIRTPYELTTHNGFILTNIYTDPVKFERSDDGLQIEYDVIVKNLQPNVRDVNLDGAALVSKEKATPMKCLTFKKKEQSFKVAANESFRINCKGTLHKFSNKNSDVKLYIAIPLDGKLMKFSYIVRSEELQ